MKLRNALELGQKLGMQTVEEIIKDIDAHKLSTYSLEQSRKEMTELYEDYRDFLKAGNPVGSSLKDAIKFIGD